MAKKEQKNKRQMKLSEVIDSGNSIYSGMALNTSMYVTKEGIYRNYQSIVSFFPFKHTGKPCSVDLKKLKGVFSTLKDAEHKFTDKNLLIGLKNISVRLPLVKTDKSAISIYKNLVKVAKKGTWKTVPDNLTDAVRACSQTVSKNAIHGTLTCISIVNNVVMTSNNVSLSIAKLDSDFDDCLMDKDAMMGAASIKPTRYKKGKGYILFANKQKILLRVPVVSGHFPDFSSIQDAKCKNYVKLDKDALQSIADVSEKLFEGGDIFDNALKLTNKNGKMKIESMSTTGGVEAILKTGVKQPFSFTIDSHTLKILTKTSTKIGVTKNKVIVESGMLKIISSVGE